MSYQVEYWLACLFTGMTVTVVSFSCREQFAGVFDFVERDLTEKLRRLRASTRNLRKYLIVWLIAIASTFLGFWLALGNLIFAFLLSFLLAAAPWYVVRRMAERHRQRIEDQLADSMGYFQSQQRGKALDVPASIEATLRQGGLPALKFYKRKQIRSLLVLEDAFAEANAWNPLAGELAEGLQRRGVPSKLLYFPDEGHSVRKLQNLRYVYQVQLSWLAEYLR